MIRPRSREPERELRQDRFRLRPSETFALLLAILFLALHLPYLPASLEDLDSINFALGVRQFDVARHQPHPPGYPVFIAAAKALRAGVLAEWTALALVSAIAGAAGVLAIAALARRLRDTRRLVPAAGTAIAVTAPLYWFTAVRPLSDMAGLAAAIGVQALTLGTSTERGLRLAAFLAGVATGIRSQVVWLTVPLLLFVAYERRLSRRGLAGVVSACAAGALVWFVPLVALSGGPAPYWRALFSQGAEDLSGIQMLWTTPTLRTLADALYYTFVAPWAVWPIAVIVLVLAAIGLGVLVRTDRRPLRLLAIAFGPYLLFDVLFQETFTSRYALPVVIPVALLAAEGLSAAAMPIALAGAIGVAMFDAHVGGRSIAAYSRQQAPAFRAIGDMGRMGRAGEELPVLAMDRRESFDMRRPLLWAGDAKPRISRTLPSPPQHEWLELVKYWDSGGRASVWSLRDPRRTEIELVQHGQAVDYQWSVPYPVLLRGVRPNDMRWLRIDRPEWYLAEGWSLTPESAGVAAADRKGLEYGPIAGGVRRDLTAGAVLAIGGRNFEPSTTPRLTVALDGQPIAELTVAPGPFFTVARVRAGNDHAGAGESGYARLTVAAAPLARVGIEQFDVAADRPVIGFGTGWNEPEFDPQTGRRWRWLSERAELTYLAAQGAMLRIEGESPRMYYSRDSRLTIRAGTTVLHDGAVGDDFAFDIRLPPAAEPSTIVVETDQIHVPAERRWRRSADRRHLGLRIFTCAVFAPDTGASFQQAR